MDNAAFHKSPRIREIIENAGCQLLYLPPCSPDLNPIEHYWVWLKNKLSYLWRHVANFYDRLSITLRLVHYTCGFPLSFGKNGRIFSICSSFSQISIAILSFLFLFPIHQVHFY
jgi:transposase